MTFTRPTGRQLVALVVALCFFAGAVGWRIGRGFPPGKDSSVVGFLYDMISHHEQAVAMSQIELANGTDPNVRVFADEIMRFQSYGIGLMERFLEEWGHSRYDAPEFAMQWMGDPVSRDSMPGMATENEMDGLRQAGENGYLKPATCSQSTISGGASDSSSVLPSTIRLRISRSSMLMVNASVTGCMSSTHAKRPR